MIGAQLPPPSHSVRQTLSLKLPIAVPVVWLSTELLDAPSLIPWPGTRGINPHTLIFT